MQCKPLSSISYLSKPFVFSSFSFSHHFLLLSVQEFEESGDPEHHFQELVSLAREGIAKGKVYLSASYLQSRSLLLGFSRFLTFKPDFSVSFDEVYTF